MYKFREFDLTKPKDIQEGSLISFCARDIDHAYWMATLMGRAEHGIVEESPLIEGLLLGPGLNTAWMLEDVSPY